MSTPNEYLAQERLKGLQRQEKQIKELEQELGRERDINDALVEANRVGRQSLIQTKRKLLGRMREDLLTAWPEDSYLLVSDFKEAIDQYLQEIEEAKEAAAKADKTAEGLYWDVQSQKDVAEKRLKKIRKQEQTIQTMENALSRQQDEAARLRGKLGEANRCNENQRQLIQTLRENSATVLIQAIKDNMAEVEKYQTKVSFDHLRQILDAYERRVNE